MIVDIMLCFTPEYLRQELDIE